MAVEAFSVLVYICILIVFYYVSQPLLSAPFLNISLAKNFLGAQAAPLAKGGEGVAVAQRRRQSRGSAGLLASRHTFGP